MQRPDLSQVDPEVVAYIEYLERKISPRVSSSSSSRDVLVDPLPEPSNETLPPDHDTRFSIVTVTRSGIAKRTLRNLYTRQHRGGMGVFGIDLQGDDTPALLGVCEETQNLLIFTSRARVFRQPANVILDNPVFARGNSIAERLALESGETITVVLAEQAKGYVALVSEGGRVRCLRHHVFGEHMRQGTGLFNAADFGPLVSACWTPGDAELFIVTQQGIGIRFAEKSISPQGDQGIKLSGDDKVVAIASIYPESNVFLLGADGRGAFRMMSGFSANKTPGGSGKIALKSSKVVSAVAVDDNEDVFIISRQGKVIRFPGNELPSTEGVVQGVNCMGLRADEVVAVLKHGPVY